MKTFASLSLVFGIAVAPMHAHAAAVRAPGALPSILDAAETAAASGAFRAQNTANITTGRIRDDDKKRSAIAFALSGLLAFTGAALWRNLTCRGGGDARHFGEGLKTQVECYEEDGSRKGWSTPTKALFGAGVGLELVSLFYLMHHLRDDGQPDDAQPASP